MNETPPVTRHDPEIAALLTDIRAALDVAVGNDLVGLYLYGSLASGGYVPGVSDIDLLAVGNQAPDAAGIARLGTALDRVVERHPSWRDRIEVAWQSVRGLRTFLTEASPMGIVSPGEPLHLIDAGEAWLINWHHVRTRGVTLFGPPPPMLIPELTRAHLLAASRWIAGLMASRIASVGHPGGQAYTVLTSCRALHTASTGERGSKEEAARWVIAQWPHWEAPIRQALADRLAPNAAGAFTVSPDAVAFVRWAADEVCHQGLRSPPI